MGRAPCCDKTKVKRGPWSPEEDATLKRYLETHGTGGNWIALPHKAGLKRCGKSCRLRWLNYLRPDIKHGGFTEEEDNIICTLYSQMGSRWSLIASQLPGRTDNDVKNYWNTKLKKKLLAGKTSLPVKTNNPNNCLTNNPTTSTQACVPKTNLAISEPPTHQNSLALPTLLSDTSNTFNLDQIHFHFGASSVTSHIVSPSQEGSSISDSSSLAMDNNCNFSVPVDGVGLEDSGMVMNPGFGFTYDLVNGSSTSLLSDFGYLDIDIKPQGLNQSIINDY